MKKNVLKPIKRFWRGFTVRSRVALCILLAAVLLLGAFGLYFLVRPDTAFFEGTESLFPSVDRSQIESIVCHTASGTSYTVKPYQILDDQDKPTGYSRFVVMTADGKEHVNLSINNMQLSQLVVGTGKNYVYTDVTAKPKADDPKYVNDPEAYETALADYNRKWQELGFAEENVPYYELKVKDTPVLDENGKQVLDEAGKPKVEVGPTYRVYYGEKDVTGNGYYIRLDGEDAIYSSKNAFVGDLLQKDGPESLLESTLFIPAQNNYAYAFPYRYAVREYVRISDEGRRITAGDTNEEQRDYSVCYTLKDGTVGYAPITPYDGAETDIVSVINAKLRGEICTFFNGKAVGAYDGEPFEFEYPTKEKIEAEYKSVWESTEKERQEYYLQNLAGEKIEWDIAEINFVLVETLRFETEYLPTLDRDMSHKFSAYGFVRPSNMQSYIPDSNVILTALQNTMELSGEVVKLGLDDAVLNDAKYHGLYKHQVSIYYPLAAELQSQDEQYKVLPGDSAAVKEKKGQEAEQAFFDDERNFVPGHLYVSDVFEEKGVKYRYVASIYYDIVVRVEASKLDYLDMDEFALSDDFVITAQITDVPQFQMIWNYGAGYLTGNYNFEVTVEDVITGGDGKDDENAQKTKQVTQIKVTYKGADGKDMTRIFIDKNGDEWIDEVDVYYQLYTRLTYTHYREQCTLSDAEIEVELSKPCALKLVQTLSDGITNYWEFYPISANRVLVCVQNGSTEFGSDFVIYGTDLQGIANGFLHLMDDSLVDENGEKYYHHSQR